MTLRWTTTILRFIRRCVPFLLALAIVVDGCMFLLTRAAAERANRAASESLLRTEIPDADPGPLPPLDGFAADGSVINVVHGNQAGWAVRFAARSCGYCKRDLLWDLLGPKLKSLGYQVVIVLPSAAEELPEDSVFPRGTAQVAYVSMEWIKRFRLTMTPTVLIFGTGQHLIWFHQGMLGPDDPKSALRAIETAERSRK